jgi:hypothetical protein
LQQVLGENSTDDMKIGLIVKLGADRVLTKVNGLPQILQLDEISYAVAHRLVSDQHIHSVNLDVLPCFASIDTISQVSDNQDEGEILLVLCHERLSPGKPSTRSAHYCFKEWLPSSYNVFSPVKLKMKSNRFPANAKFNKAFHCGGEGELITAVFLWPHLLSLSRSITKNFDQGAAMLVLFTVGVDSKKQGICPLCLANKVHGVPGLYDGMKLKLYQEIYALIGIVQSVRCVALKRPWDPGVHVIIQADTEKEGERLWDPGITTATAWGQAVFRGWIGL